MSPLRSGFGLALFAGMAAAQQEPAAITVVLPASAVAGEVVDLAVRFELDRRFFAEKAVPLLQRVVDLPVQILPTAALGDLVPGEGPSVAVGDHLVRAFALEAMDRDGRTFDRFEVRWRWTGPGEGSHDVGAELRYAYASGFEETLLGGRQPVDRHEAAVSSPEARIEVGAVPGDAPPGYSGAIGDFTVTASAGVTEVEVGDSFVLELQVRGAGNLATFAAPPWPQWPGFAVQGLAERPGDGVRRFVFDVLALAEGAVVPGFAFVFYRPTSSSYRTVTAAPVELQVVARGPGRPLSPRVEKLISRQPVGAIDRAQWWWLLLGVLLIPMVAVWRRRRSAE